MSSALKQPVLPPTGTSNSNSGTNTNIANSPLNKNIQQSTTLPSLGNPQVGNKTLTQPTNMQMSNATPLGVNRNFQQSGNMQHNIPSAQGYNSQVPSHNQNIITAHQQPVPNMAHQQSVQNMQQAVTAHQVHPQVAPDMQQASTQLNKPVNCSSTTVTGAIPSPVNMVQERASNVQSQPVQSVSLPSTTTTQNISTSLTSTTTSSMSTSPVTTSSQPLSVPSAPSISSQKTNTGNSTENTSSTTVPAPSLVKSAQSNGTVDTSGKPPVESIKENQSSSVDSQTLSQTVTSTESTDSDVASVEKDDNNTSNKEDISLKCN